MNKAERTSRLEQVDRELTRTLEDMQRTASAFADHPADMSGFLLDELARFSRQLASTRDYLREVQG